MTIWADRWTRMHRWWSVRLGVGGVLALAIIPAISDRWPDFAPSLIAWFPTNGAQWVPVVGGILAVIARVISQGAVVAVFRRLLGKKEGDDAANQP